MNTRLMKVSAFILAYILSNIVVAQDVLMIRSSQSFPETMTTLQNSIMDHKYVVSRVQRVDIGLTKAGYKTDLYRIVFFGKHAEIKKITDKHPELVPYLPLKIAIFSEKDETILTVLNPANFSKILNNPELNILYQRWANDVRSILDDVAAVE